MDYYKVLEVETTASIAEIKRSYQQLILRHHPDKNLESGGNIETFVQIDEAYKILRDPVSRKEYDSKRFQQATSCQMIVHDTLRRSEFLYDESNNVNYHICKCGGWYILDEDATEHEYIICCDECSLAIKVINKIS